jgi:aspartate aminotransferase
MPVISKKGEAMPSSPIRKLVPFANQAKSEGVHVYHLNIGQPDLATPKAFWDTLHTLDMKVLEYCPSNGFESYRAKFANYYNRIGIEVNKDNFIITNGGSEALSFVMMSCLNEGDEIIIPEPMYANYIGFATAGNIVVKPLTRYIEDGFDLPSIELFEQNITPKTKAILICNPNNPTGYFYTKTELERLREIVLKHDLYLIVDEVYREFLYSDEQFFSSLNLAGLEKNVIVIDSISKRFSACGARVGAVVTRNEEVLATVMKFAQARLSPPSLGQIAGESLFDLGQDYYDGIVAEYKLRRDTLVAALRAIPGVKCPSPGGAFYTVAELPIDDSDKFCQWMLEKFRHNNSTVMMAPATGFYTTPEFGMKQVRIAYVLNTDDLKAAMECLRLGIEKYNQQ